MPLHPLGGLIILTELERGNSPLKVHYNPKTREVVVTKRGQPHSRHPVGDRHNPRSTADIKAQIPPA